MQDNSEPLEQAVRDLAETTGVDYDTINRVLHGLGACGADRLSTFMEPEDVITGKDLHLTIRVGNVLISC
ncbi:hypothetical protein ACFWG6_32845 [Streptomyces erythrochromogenes]|uniref:hypothetical protein n=1 Tax=Streptomyces erythrochromogenes TaxID=285574 RepID=UPI00362BBDAE